jgi:hypothetical protein
MDQHPHQSTPTLRWLFVALVALGGFGAACNTTAYVHIRHPLQVGVVDPNSVPFENTSAERQRGLPAGVLVDQASLVEMTPDRVCIQTNVWSLASQPQRGDYRNYRVVLLSDVSGVENTQGEIVEQQRTQQAYQGHIAQRVQTGTRRVCAARNRQGVCTRFRQQAVYQTVYRPHIWTVVQNPASVCFVNGGFITPATTRVALEFRPNGGAGSFTFEWQLDNTVSGGVQQTSGGSQ